MPTRISRFPQHSAQPPRRVFKRIAAFQHLPQPTPP